MVESTVYLPPQSFIPADQQAIFVIPTSSEKLADDFLLALQKFWGNFSVKSGYRLGRWLDEPASSSRGSTAASWWKCLLSLKVPHKIKVFIWKACSGWVPENLNLVRKGDGRDPGCLFRCGEAKSTLHAS
ncbi:hypothetical protein ACOSQ3_019678 [Xanthoceras sorbifolium]